MSENRKKGLQRPPAPVDLFTLKPEPDLVSEREPGAGAEAQEQKEAAISESASGRASRTERIKTSVEFSPETIDLIEEIKSQYRRKHRRHLPTWKILDEAVRSLADHQLEGI